MRLAQAPFDLHCNTLGAKLLQAIFLCHSLAHIFILVFVFVLVRVEKWLNKHTCAA